MNYTSIEQSKKLINLGLNPETADMFYPNAPITVPCVDDGRNKGSIFIPCWSIGALIRLMPDIMKDKYKLSINNSGILYSYYSGYQRGIRYIDKESFGDLSKTCFNIVVWLLENGYIKKRE